MTGGTVGDGCVFCRAATGDDPLVVHRGTAAFVILNLFPYNNGHVMVVPRRHIATLGEATAEELGELMTLVRDAERVLTAAYQPHGINVGLNLGRAAVCSRVSGRTRASATTVMKLVSPFQRGTRCTCR